MQTESPSPGFRYDFYDLSKLPIQENHVYWCMLEGHRAASDPNKSAHDDGYGLSRDTRIRCYRIAWRTAFRRARIRHLLATTDTFERTAESRAWKVAA